MHFVRPCLAKRALVADSLIYMWHIETGELLETLDGSSTGCVNAISWNPVNHRMVASAGDDRVVKM